MSRIIFIYLIFFNFLVHAEEKINIAYASSLHPIMQNILLEFEKDLNYKVAFSSGGSGSLAQQALRGAPFDMIISADPTWIQYLNNKHILKDKQDWISNQLVFISNQKKDLMQLNISKNEKLCLADPQLAPLGTYSYQVINFYQLKFAKKSILHIRDSASLLSNLKMGECDYGIIFASDLKKINNRYHYQNIPLNSHQEIIYSIGIITNNAINEKFISFLNSEKTKIKLIDQGFIIRP